jgi:hypothetical protein
MSNLFEKIFVEPFKRLAAQSAWITPAVITVIAVLVVGGVLAFLARQVVYWLLVAVRFDRWMARSGMGAAIERTGVFRSASDFVSRIAQGLVWLVTILAALSSVPSPLTAALVIRLVNYVPELIGAGLILLLGSVVSKFLARATLLAAVNAQWSGARLAAGAVRILIMSLAVAIALEELHIGHTVVLVSFGILFGGLVVAASIAFGLALRDVAQGWLQSKIERKLPEEERILDHL